jgi:hypothetical protein
MRLHEAVLFAAIVLMLIVGIEADGQQARNGDGQCVECPAGPPGEPGESGPTGPPGPAGTCEDECVTTERVCTTTIELCDLPANPCNNFRGRWVCHYDSNGVEVLREKPRVRARGLSRTEALAAWVALRLEERGCVSESSSP